jgi:3-phenylpropionate/trans-cinnamate dioxygenase ferredoxin subunit
VTGLKWKPNGQTWFSVELPHAEPDDMGWIRIFRDHDLRDEMLPAETVRLLKVGDKRICLARTQDTIFAIQDECTHSRASLSKGSLNTFSEVICPLHGYRFNLKTGSCSERNCPDAETYPVRENDGATEIRMPD